jgi:hypothetical protein
MQTSSLETQKPSAFVRCANEGLRRDTCLRGRGALLSQVGGSPGSRPEQARRRRPGGSRSARFAGVSSRCRAREFDDRSLLPGRGTVLLVGEVVTVEARPDARARIDSGQGRRAPWPRSTTTALWPARAASSNRWRPAHSARGHAASLTDTKPTVIRDQLGARTDNGLGHTTRAFPHRTRGRGQRVWP